MVVHTFNLCTLEKGRGWWIFEVGLVYRFSSRITTEKFRPQNPKKIWGGCYNKLAISISND